MEERIEELKRQNEDTEARVEKLEALRHRYEQEAHKCEAQLSKLVSQYKDMQKLILAQKRLKDFPSEPLQMKRHDSGVIGKPHLIRDESVVLPSTFGVARNDHRVYTSSGDETSSRLVYEYSHVTSNANSNDRRSAINARPIPQRRQDSSDDDCEFEIDDEESSNVYLKRFLKRKEMVELQSNRQMTPVAKGKRLEGIDTGPDAQTKDVKKTVVSLIKHKIESKIHNPNFLKRL